MPNKFIELVPRSSITFSSLVPDAFTLGGVLNLPCGNLGKILNTFDIYLKMVLTATEFSFFSDEA